MCLAIPGKIIRIDNSDPAMITGTVDFGGVRKEINLAFVADASIGDYVIVHAGFALNRLDEEQARISLEYLDQISRAGSAGDDRA